MVRVNIDLDEQEYNLYMSRKGSLTHRQILLGTIGLLTADRRRKNKSLHKHIFQEYYDIYGIPFLNMLSLIYLYDDENLLKTKLKQIRGE